MAYKLTDHTADIGISVSNKTLKGLYLNAAKGLVDVCLCHPRGRGGPVNARDSPANTTWRARRLRGNDRSRSKNIVVKAVDREQLLVKWLQEILFLINAKRFVPTGFKILSLTERTLKAHISYVPFDPGTHEVGREIKAVTYHDLSIKKSGGQFRATVIFDI